MRRLRFDVVEGRAVRFGQAGDQKQNEAEELWNHEPEFSLRLNDGRKAERSGQQHDPH